MGSLYKALKEANAHIATIRAKLGFLSIKKETTSQALTQEKVGWANAGLALAQEKEWRVEELDKLAAMKEETKAKLKKRALDTAVEYAMCF